MNESNGTNGVEASAEAPVNRLPAETGKKGKGKKNLTAFQRWHAALNSAEGGKDSTTLTRKTEEGSLTIKIKGFITEHNLDEAISVAQEVGLVATTKTEGVVGKYDATASRKLADDAAAGFVEYCAD